MRKIILTLNLNLVLKCWICFPWLSEPEVGQHCLWGFVILRATPIVAISTHTAGWGPSLYLPVADTNTPSEPKGTKKEISQNHCPWSSQWTAVHCHSWQSPDRGGWGFSCSAPQLCCHIAFSVLSLFLTDCARPSPLFSFIGIFSSEVWLKFVFVALSDGIACRYISLTVCCIALLWHCVLCKCMPQLEMCYYSFWKQCSECCAHPMRKCRQALLQMCLWATMVSVAPIQCVSVHE